MQRKNVFQRAEQLLQFRISENVQGFHPVAIHLFIDAASDMSKQRRRPYPLRQAEILDHLLLFGEQLVDNILSFDFRGRHRLLQFLAVACFGPGCSKLLDRTWRLPLR